MKNNFHPLVSIVIPVYNGSNYMREAIDSAVNQTYDNIEIIVVNDGSIDNTEEIARSYGDKIRYFSKENGGVATALNLAIKESTGDYISWLSHDDVYYLDKIEKQIEKLSELNQTDRLNTILMSNYSLMNEKSELTSNQQFQGSHDLKKLNYSLYPILKGIVHGCTLLIPKHCFDEIGNFDEKLKTTQDYDLWFRMFPSYSLLFMPDLLVKSRWHDEQGSKKITVANKEADVLWIKMVDGLTDDQKVMIDSSALLFYQKTRSLMEGAHYAGAEKHLSEIIDNYKNRDISQIRVSVIIPFHNRVNWTIEAVQSVLNQSHANFEIILVDDHSSESIDSIKMIAKSDERIMLVENKRGRGVSGARNTGLDMITGEYVAFLDSDDLFFPDKITKQLRKMVRDGILFSHTSYTLFSDGVSERDVIESGNKSYSFPSIIAGCSIATPTVMIHADFFKNKDNRFSEKYAIGEDICLWIKLSSYTQCRGILGVLTKVRRHDHNAAYDELKQVQGISNILDYVVTNSLDKDNFEYVKRLNQTFLYHLERSYNNTESFKNKSDVNQNAIAGKNSSLDFATRGNAIKNKIRKILRKFIFTVSPTFRMLVGNRERMNDVLSTLSSIKIDHENFKALCLDEFHKFSIQDKNEKTVLLEQLEKLINKVEKLEKNNEFFATANRNRLNRIIDNLLDDNKQKNEIKISIVCLIYKSTKFARAVYDSLYKYTPMLKTGDAELLFVANDATPEVLSYLKTENYNFIINNNPVHTDEELFDMGYGVPEYINRVYRGYNIGIKNCKGDIVVLINSDNMFSPNWLENLLIRLDENSVVCSQLVERKHPKFGVFPTAVRGEFGENPDTYREEEFLDFARTISRNAIIPGGAYMPCMTYKKNFEKVGYYPEGNIAGKTFQEVVQYGDENLYEKLEKNGVEHVTVCDSIVYHFKEGEKED